MYFFGLSGKYVNSHPIFLSIERALVVVVVGKKQWSKHTLAWTSKKEGEEEEVDMADDDAAVAAAAAAHDGI